MTDERYCAPMPGARASGNAPSLGAVAATDLFAHDTNLCHEPHPDFAARAAIWRDQRAGLISLAEAQRLSAAIGVLRESRNTHSRAPARECARPRHQRPAPNASRQYADCMSTTAARDDRLTPNAKALLQVLRARCGKGRSTRMAKGTLAAIMSRSARTIARYLRDLEAFGYIATEIHRNGRGLHLGLVVTLLERTLPFFEEAKALAGWLAEAPAALATAFAGVVSAFGRVTKLPSKNQTRIFNPLESGKKALERRGGASLVPR